MNLTPQEAALAWARGKKLEAKRQDVADRWESIIQVGGVSGFWSAAIFGPDVHLFAFRLAPGETIEPKPAVEGGPDMDAIAFEAMKLIFHRHGWNAGLSHSSIAREAYDLAAAMIEESKRRKA